MTRKRNARKRRRSNGVHVAADEATSNLHSGDIAEPTKAAEGAEATAPDNELVTDCDDTGTFLGVDYPDEDTGDGEALMSLQRLEADIRELHTRWADVEGELAARDMDINRLQEEREVQHAAFKSLQAELDEARLQEEESRAQADTIREKLAEQEIRLQAQVDEQVTKDQVIAAGIAALADMQAQRDALSQTGKALEQQLAEQSQDVDTARQQAQVQQTVIADLRVKNQEFEAYIDRRKADWDRLNEDLANYRDALAGMEQSLAGKAAEFAGQEEAKLQLSEAVIDLEKRCAEMDGRRAEREQANQELQGLLSECASEIESLKNELRQAEAAGTPLHAEIKEQACALSEAREEIRRLQAQALNDRQSAEAAEKALRDNADNEIQSMREQLDEALLATSQAQKELANSQQCITAMEADMQARQTQLDQVWSAAAATDEKLGRATDERDALQAECDDLKARLTEVQSEFADHRRITSLDLEASTGRAAELAAELQARNAALETLNRNVKMVGKINASVQRLDKQMSSGASTEENDAAAEQRTRRLMVAIQGEKKIRYPIYKDSMTIGRSPENDIQIRQKWISRQHARIVINDEAVTIEDMGSKNGILVNNKPISSGALNDQDMVDIGETRFQFVDLMHKPGETMN